MIRFGRIVFTAIVLVCVASSMEAMADLGGGGGGGSQDDKCTLSSLRCTKHAACTDTSPNICTSVMNCNCTF